MNYTDLPGRPTPAKQPMTVDDLHRIVNQIKYKDEWWLKLIEYQEGRGFELQWSFFAVDATAPSELIREQSCRKWGVSVWMTESEVVQTAYAAALMAEAHECSEHFQYKGVSVFNHHVSVDQLLTLKAEARP